MNLLHLIKQEWFSRPGRALLTALSVAIAVATLMGVMLAAKASRSAYKQLSAQLEGAPALEVVAKAGGRFEQQQVAKLAKLPEATAALPLLYRGTIARFEGARSKLMLLGTDLEKVASLPGFALLEGNVPKAKGEVLIEEAFAKRKKMTLGSRFSILAGRGTRVKRVTLVVSGICEGKVITPFAENSGILLSLADLQRYYEVGSEVDKVRLQLTDDKQRAALLPQVQAVLPPELLAQVPAGRTQLAEEMLKSGEIALQFATALSLGMAALIILNTMRMNFAERRKQLAILRCLGCTQTQISRLLLWEGGLFGLLGTLFGIPAGLLVAQLLSRGMQELLDTQIPSVTLSWEALAIACVAGPAVSLIAAFLPARQAYQVTPLEGLLEVDPGNGDQFPILAAMLGMVVWLCAGAILVGVTQHWVAPQIAVGAGLLMMIAFVIWIPVLFVPLVRTLLFFVPARFQFSAQMAAEQLLRRGTRTALTIGVLVVAIANSVGMGNAIQSNVADVRDCIAQTLTGDHILQRNKIAGDESGYVPADDAAKLQLTQTAGVRRVSVMGFVPLRVQGEPSYCQVREFFAGEKLPLRLMDAPADEVVLQQLAEGGALIGSPLSKKLGKVAGDILRIEVQGRTLEVKCIGITNDYNFGGMTLVMDWQAAAQRWELEAPDYYVVDAEKGEYPNLVGQLQAVADQNQLELFSVGAMRQSANKSADAVVASLWALMGIGFVVGGFGIGNTLMMSVLEQTRELGLLRIIGMTPTQIGRLILSEALLLGVIGVLIGSIGGLMVAVTIHSINEPLLGRAVTFHFQYWLLAVNVALGLVVVVLAAWLPGRRASQLRLLEAISCE